MTAVTSGSHHRADNLPIFTRITKSAIIPESVSMQRLSSRTRRRLWSLVLLILFSSCYAERAEWGHVPKGSNPTLYDPTLDPILQLDEITFNDTIYRSNMAFVVEFYADWCGHCRTFAPLYKALAKDINSWQSIVTVAAVNCADTFNDATCRANGVSFFPFIKYFPRRSKGVTSGTKLRPLQSLAEMRDQLTTAVLFDYEVNRFNDWPIFDYLGDISTYGELWEGSSESATNLAVIFEQSNRSYVGAQLLLDLHKYDARLFARRCLQSHPLVDALRITDFPTIAIFKRGERVPVLIAELRRLLLSELEEFLRSDSNGVDGRISNTIQQPSSGGGGDNGTSSVVTIDCDANPALCKPLFYSSETDMLKAIRYALVREVTRGGGYLQGGNLSSLVNFVDVLARHFPHSSSVLPAGGTRILNNSDRARVIFMHMKNWLETQGYDAVIDVNDWQREFEIIEEEQGNPFPVSAKWQHCAGSANQYRGYTCGLWTTFHAITVQAYLDRGTDDNEMRFRALPVLQGIRDWVSAFFGCEHCRDHFIRMTTRTYKMEAQVRKPEDVFLYLWKAHNIVNARLKGRNTEDPQFPKTQFPPRFLCPQCSDPLDNVFNESHVRTFLLNYYSSIQPVQYLSSTTIASAISTNTVSPLSATLLMSSSTVVPA